MRSAYVSMMLAIILASCAQMEATGPSKPNPYRVIFTTGLDNRNKPVNDVSEISISEKRIYLIVNWQISAEEHTNVTIISDGVGNVVCRPEQSFTPKGSFWTTRSWCRITSHIDQPGQWKFEVYMDGEKALEEYLTVTPKSE